MDNEKDANGYNNKVIEKKWQNYWTDKKIFKFDRDSNAPIFSIDNPPRYTSGPLHMGHAIGYSLIDFVARYKRMRGYNVFFPLCYDANGMPIEVKIEKEYGVNKNNTDREKLVEICKTYSNSNISEMTNQFRMLGVTMDPSIYYQTDSEEFRKQTQITFLRMYEQNLVYRKEHPVIWCPHCETSLSLADVEYEEENRDLLYLKFSGDTDGVEDLTIATTRPELLHTCQLILVNPDDTRYSGLIGKKFKVPIFNQVVTLLSDSKVEMNFGTGAVMVCTIGDKDDLYWSYKYNLNFIKGIDEKGRLTSVAGKFSGLTVNEARTEIIKQLKKDGILIKNEPVEQNVGKCWRCHSPVEFVTKINWFLKTIEFKDMIKDASKEITWHPSYMVKRLEAWVDSLLWDWCISRQRYFATPIPVWICGKCGNAVPAKESQCYVDPTRDAPPVDKCPACGGHMIGSDEVFDTWMDSSITPLYNTGWNRDNAMFNRMYPMSLRPQAHEIIRTWVFYTILRCKLLVNDTPWKEIMIHGFIMAPDGKPMHASAGNAINPLPIIEEYGADAWRYYTAKCKLGEDTAFQIKEIIHGKRFVNKIYNIMNFVKHAVDIKNVKEIKPDKLTTIDRWLLTIYSNTLHSVTDYYENYEFDKAVLLLEDFIWHTFADYYIEMVKGRVKEGDDSAFYTLRFVGLGILKLLSPITPHIAEESFQNIYKNDFQEESIHLLRWDSFNFKDESSYNTGMIVKKILSSVWTYSATAHISNFKKIYITATDRNLADTLRSLKKLLKADDISFVDSVSTVSKPLRITLRKDKIGSVFRADTPAILERVKNASIDDLYRNLTQYGKYIVTINGVEYTLVKDYFLIETTEVLDGIEIKQIPTSPDMSIHIYASQSAQTS